MKKMNQPYLGGIESYGSVLFQAMGVWIRVLGGCTRESLAVHDLWSLRAPLYICFGEETKKMSRAIGIKYSNTRFHVSVLIQCSRSLIRNQFEPFYISAYML